MPRQTKAAGTRNGKVGRPADRETVRIDTVIDRQADDVIRKEILAARGNLAAWWEQASYYLLKCPDARRDITQAMVDQLAGKRRRRSAPQ